MAQPATEQTTDLFAADQAANAPVAGEIERIIYGPNDKGFCILLLAPSKAHKALIVKGILPNARQGMTVECEGEFITDPKYGDQFNATALIETLPKGNAGVARYLSETLTGVGMKMAETMVETHGPEEIFRVLDEAPEKLLSIKGLGKKKLERIKADWHEARGSYRVMVLLRKIGIGPELANRAFVALGGPDGADVKSLIEQNPYVLTKVSGIGFGRADQAALKLGVPKDSPFRIEACARYVLENAIGEGHTYLPYREVGAQVYELTKASKRIIVSVMDHMLHDPDKIVVPEYGVTEGWDRWLMLPFLHASERGIARNLFRLRQGAGLFAQIDPRRFENFHLPLHVDQIKAIQTALTQKVSVLTGGPGMGKTQIVRFIVELARERDARIILVAPTGRAAKQLEAATGQEAMTVHRALGWGSPTPVQELECDLVVMDESSMTDTPLAHAFLKAVPDHATVLFVGDVDQLPSVGPGNVLGDFIESGAVPVSRLSKVFRQGEGSGVAAAARQVIRGEIPTFASDFTFTEIQEPVKIADAIVAEVARLSQLVELDDLQVLSPMRDGPIGVTELNRRLQAVLNPPHPSKREVAYGDYTFREGDRVMQTKNNYDLGIVNGDLGAIRVIVDDDKLKLVVDFSGRTVEIERAGLLYLQLAYATTIHKSQGGQYKEVLMPISHSHYKMLNRNLSYTGITRASEGCRLFGTMKAIQTAVRTEMNRTRRTGLVRAIRAYAMGGQRWS